MACDSIRNVVNSVSLPINNNWYRIIINVVSKEHFTNSVRVNKFKKREKLSTRAGRIQLVIISCFLVSCFLDILKIYRLNIFIVILQYKTLYKENSIGHIFGAIVCKCSNLKVDFKQSTIPLWTVGRPTYLTVSNF